MAESMLKANESQLGRMQVAFRRALRPVRFVGGGEGSRDTDDELVIDLTAKQGGSDNSTPLGHGIARVRNTSGADVPKYAVLGIFGQRYSSEDDLQKFKVRRTLSGVTPEVPEHNHKFVITLEPILEGKTGLAVASGIISVPITTVNEADDFAVPINDDTTGLRTSGGGGARILGKAHDWAIVLLPAQPVSGMFPVIVARSDTSFFGGLGSQGTSTSAPTFTYDVFDLGGNVLGFDLSPEYRIANVGRFVAGGGPNNKVGSAYYDNEGALHLYNANEQLDARAC